MTLYHHLRFTNQTKNKESKLNEGDDLAHLRHKSVREKHQHTLKLFTFYCDIKQYEIQIIQMQAEFFFSSREQQKSKDRKHFKY